MDKSYLNKCRRSSLMSCLGLLSIKCLLPSATQWWWKGATRSLFLGQNFSTNKLVKLYWKLVKGINKNQIFWSVRKCLNVFVSISQVHCSKVFCSHENEWVNNLSTYKKSILRKVFDMILKLNLNCLGKIDSYLTSHHTILKWISKCCQVQSVFDQSN